ncbi:MAG: DinB family protein [Candidatus Acidiferrum sp.]
MSEEKVAGPEPWLRETLTDVEPVARGVLHALELAKEDLRKWCGALSDEQLNRRPGGLASVAFQLRHISRSLDRLLTYAEGSALNEEQLHALRTEMEEGVTRAELFGKVEAALERSARRVRALAGDDYSAVRLVGKKQLKTTLGGLLVHVAEHTQRHVGQAIITAKLVGRAESL